MKGIVSVLRRPPEKSAASNPAAILVLIAEVRELREDADRWRTEMALRNDPEVAIMFFGTENRYRIYRGGIPIASGDTYAKSIDAARAASEPVKP